MWVARTSTFTRRKTLTKHPPDSFFTGSAEVGTGGPPMDPAVARGTASLLAPYTRSPVPSCYAGHGMSLEPGAWRGPRTWCLFVAALAVFLEA